MKTETKEYEDPETRCSVVTIEDPILAGSVVLKKSKVEIKEYEGDAIFEVTEFD